MKKLSRRKDLLSKHPFFNHIFIILFMLIFLLNCGGGGGDGGGTFSPPNQPQTFSPTLGAWSGDNISFTLSEGSIIVDSLSWKYSGTADGTTCNVNYNGNPTINANIEVIDNAFAWEGTISPLDFLISCTFTSATTSTCDISWSGYNSNCDAMMEGSSVYSATYGAPPPVSSYSIEDAYLQYRNYPDPSRNLYTAWIEVTKDGAPIVNADGLLFRITDSSGSVLTPTRSTFYPPTDALFYDCSTTPCKPPQQFPDGGFVADFDNIPAGNYRLEVDTGSGQIGNMETEDDCIRISVDSTQQLNRLPDEFNYSESPKAGYVFFVAELNIVEIKCGYIFFKTLDNNIFLIDSNYNTYPVFKWQVQNLQVENPSDITSSKALSEGSILKIAFEIPLQSNLSSIEYTYDYGSSWADYNSSSRATINIDLSNTSDPSNDIITKIEATKDLSYPGKVVLPFVNVITMESSYSNAGDLVLSWTNPRGDANWDKVNQLRIVLMANDYTSLVYISANPNSETLTIPKSLINQAENLGYGNVSWWAIQTRAYDNNNMNYARGYSS